MDVRLPDGRIVQGVPDTMTQGELKTILQKNLIWVDPTDEMSGPERVVAGVSQGVRTLGRGIGQRAGLYSNEEIADLRKQDAPLLRTTGGATGSVIGAAAPAVGLSLVPGVNTFTGAAVLGAGMGAAQPTVEGESVTGNMTRGALLSLGGQAVGRAIGGPIPNRNTAPQQDLVNLATQKYGIDLPASARTGSKGTAYLESQIATAPGGGRMADALSNTNQQYSRAVMREVGVDDLATGAALGQAAGKTQQAYRDIWARNMVKADDDLVGDLADAVSKAYRTLTPEKAKVVERQVDNILSKVRQDGTIDGSIYQTALRPEVRSTIKSDSALYTPLRDVQAALDRAANRSISAADSEGLKAANYQYALQKRLGPAIEKAEARGGTFTPGAVATATKGFTGDINELGKIGAGLLREPPQSGTVPRALYSSILMGGPAAGYGYMTGGPETAAMYGGLGLLAPFAAAQVLGRPGLQSYLARGIVPMSPEGQAALNAGTRAGVLSAPILLNSDR